MDVKLTDSLIGAVAARLGAHDFKRWFYGDSVGFEGLIAASDNAGAAWLVQLQPRFLSGVGNAHAALPARRQHGPRLPLVQAARREPCNAPFSEPLPGASTNCDIS